MKLFDIKYLFGGGGGNRTRVRKYYSQASTCLSCFLISDGKPPAGRLLTIPSPLILASRSGERQEASLLADVIPGTQTISR